MEDFNSDELKKEANNTFSDVKSSFKDVDIKQESKNATNFFQEMINDPISKTKEVAKNDNKQYMKTSIFILVIWTIATFTYSLIYTFKYRVAWFAGYNFFDNLLYIIGMTAAPVLSILLMSLIVFMFKKKNNKNLTSIITSLIIAYIPVVIGTFLRLLELTTYRLSGLILTINSVLYLITVILSYFAIEDVCEEDNLKFIKKFILIKGIYLIAVYVISLLGIALYN